MLYAPPFCVQNYANFELEFVEVFNLESCHLVSTCVGSKLKGTFVRLLTFLYGEFLNTWRIFVRSNLDLSLGRHKKLRLSIMMMISVFQMHLFTAQNIALPEMSYL